MGSRPASGSAACRGKYGQTHLSRSSLAAPLRLLSPSSHRSPGTASNRAPRTDRPAGSQCRQRVLAWLGHGSSVLSACTLLTCAPAAWPCPAQLCGPKCFTYAGTLPAVSVVPNAGYTTSAYEILHILLLAGLRHSRSPAQRLLLQILTMATWSS
jgi:hypothetical protein